MRLLEFMRKAVLTDEAMAALIGDCSPHAVRKWKYGEREPDAATMVRIETVTDGKVTLRDWVRDLPAEEPPPPEPRKPKVKPVKLPPDLFEADDAPEPVR
jgi:DNA-binding transcriptional regulator YdaS (Cro superfamily)